MFRIAGSWLLLCFLWVVSLLPLPLLYLFSDLSFLLVYFLVKYRKKVVLDNLYHSFPQKSDRERRKIARRFYHHFCDILFEEVKLLSMNPREVARRVEFKNRELLDRYHAEGRTVIAVSGHYGNWEWLGCFGILSGYPMMVSYKYLNDPVFEKQVVRIRQRLGVEPVPMKQTVRALKAYHEQGTAVICCMVADQSPVVTELEYFTPFLNQETAVFLGIERLARKYNYPVVFVAMRKKRRGRYQAEIIPVADQPEKTAPSQITEKHVRLLESLILEKPEYWMWSHRRWKFSRKNMMRKRSMYLERTRNQT
jgi:KDO2-lipid IV(A) lauroyltransferase